MAAEGCTAAETAGSRALQAIRVAAAAAEGCVAAKATAAWRCTAAEGCVATDNCRQQELQAVEICSCRSNRAA